MRETGKETSKIKEVDNSGEWYSITLENGSGFGIEKRLITTDIVPTEGDDVLLHTIGSYIRGVELNGELLYYKSDEDMEQERIESQKKYKEEKIKDFIEKRHGYDEQYNALPECFKARINRFRNNNPYFRIDYEGYELMCCTQAHKMAECFKTDEKLVEFANAKWEEQKEMFPDLDHGHSGNSFGASVTLARIYLDNPDNVSKMHGSLATLVGSVEYGDNNELTYEKQEKFEKEFGENNPYIY